MFIKKNDLLIYEFSQYRKYGLLIFITGMPKPEKDHRFCRHQANNSRDTSSVRPDSVFFNFRDHMKTKDSACKNTKILTGIILIWYAWLYLYNYVTDILPGARVRLIVMAAKYWDNIIDMMKYGLLGMLQPTDPSSYPTILPRQYIKFGWSRCQSLA